MQIFLIIILIIFIAWGISQIYFVAVRGRAPWFPSPNSTRRIAVENITLDPGQVFAELGAGSGVLARKLAKKYPTNQIYAYEISYIPFILGSLLSGRYKNLNFISGDIIKADLSMVDTFYTFTNPGNMAELSIKLTRHPRPALLYAYVFHLPNHEIIKTIPTNNHNIYLYKI